MVNFFRRAYENTKSFFKKVSNPVKGFFKKLSSSITPEATETPNLSGEPLTCARISKAVYSNPKTENIDGFLLDKELSKYNIGVYQNPSSQKVIIGFRGTAALEDLSTDLDIVKGRTNDIQYKEADDIYKKVKEKYPNFEIIATGHSKGGSLGLYLNTKYNIKFYGFNSGVGLGVISYNPNKSKAHLYIIKGDLISGLGSMGNLGIVHVFNSKFNDASPLQAHSMDNYL
jgi:hypothetical protein